MDDQFTVQKFNGRRASHFIADKVMELNSDFGNDAHALDSQSLSIGKDLGDLFYLARDYDQALEQYRRTLRLDPTDPVGVSIHRAMGWAYEFHGMHEQAIAEFIETARIQNASPERLSALRQGFDWGS